ncbi:MAG: AmmeMemoRadiSam system protein B [Candidatus Kapabacteria bacterium]|nr:AmmeMemoRadiSam system protein B [Candidatus Kapabacteria bacterium]
MKLIPLNEAIPFIRDSIQFSLIPEDNALIAFDTDKYIEEPIAFHSHILEILELINGENTIIDLHSILHYQKEIEVTLEDVQSVISYIDSIGILESEQFFLLQQKMDSEYFNSPIRNAICAGSSYPKEKEELHTYLDSVFSSNDSEQTIDSVAALIPHIDFRVGIEPYVAAYKHIRFTNAITFFIIGTSHYSNLDQFILTDKDFDTPLGLVKTNKEIIQRLHSLTQNKFTKNDIAHKPEHSIEFHAVMLKYLFPNRDFTIVPILVTSFQHFISSGKLPTESQKIQDFSNALSSIIEELGSNAYVISSGDLAHVGKKFGDDVDAYSKKEEVSINDSNLLAKLELGDKDAFYAKIQQQHDSFRICGLPPTYSLLASMKPLQGTTVALQQWYEEDTHSMVSFGSVLFQYKEEIV